MPDRPGGCRVHWVTLRCSVVTALRRDDEEAARCAFCAIAAGTAPATIVREWWDALAIVPLNPVTEGHLLVIPRAHVADAVESPAVTAMAMGCAAELAAGLGASNILTSVGAAATQSVFHLHIHVVPRSHGDQLMLPWGTIGDPHEPHRCAGMDRLSAALAKFHDLTRNLATRQ